MTSITQEVSTARVPARPMVSVWMITYNHERFIQQAIESAVAQNTAFDFEIVIGEDCSTDRTREIVRDYQLRYPDRIRLILQHVSSGARANASSTFVACRGKYIAMLEGDDYWTDPLKLQLQVDLMEATPNAFMCGARAGVLHDGESEPSTILPEGESSILSSYGTRELFCGAWWFRTCTKLVPRGLMHAVPGRYASDWGWTMFLIAHTRFAPVCFLDRVVGVYREHAGGIWSSAAESTRLEKDVQTLHDLIPLFTGTDRAYLRDIMLDRVQRLVEHPHNEASAVHRAAVLALKRSPMDSRSWRNLAISLLGRR